MEVSEEQQEQEEQQEEEQQQEQQEEEQQEQEQHEEGQRLPTITHHKIPDFSKVADLNIAKEQSVELTGNHNVIAVYGEATISGSVSFVTLLVYPGGKITIRPGAEVIIRDVPIDTSKDPEQWGHGIIVIDGEVDWQGTSKTPWLRCDSSLEVGDSVLKLDSPPPIVTGKQ